MPEAPSPVLRVAWMETQTAQSAIIGLPASCVLTAVTPPPALTVVHGKAKEIEAVGRNLQVMPGQVRSQITRNLNLVVSFLQVRARCGILTQRKDECPSLQVRPNPQRKGV